MSLTVDPLTGKVVIDYNPNATYPTSLFWGLVQTFVASAGQIVIQVAGSLGSTIKKYIFSATAAPAQDTTILINDPGVAQVNLKTGVNKTVTLSAIANTTITTAQSGQVFFIPQQTVSNTITMPAAFAGGNYKFICTATADGTHTLTMSPPTSICNGQTIGVVGGLVPVAFTTKASLILGATAANLKTGDWCTWDSDGTSWFITAYSSGIASAWTAP